MNEDQLDFDRTSSFSKSTNLFKQYYAISLRKSSNELFVVLFRRKKNKRTKKYLIRKTFFFFFVSVRKSLQRTTIYYVVFHFEIRNIYEKPMVENQAEGPYYRIEETKNVDLRNERLKATFDTEVLTQFMFGGEKAHFPINLRRQIARLAYSHPVHSTHLPLEYLDAEEFYTVLIRKSFIAIREAQRLNIDDNKILGWYLSTFTNGRFLFGLHTGMFMHTLETMASEEQQNKFLPLARSFRIIGTYAQTELGHGSNIQSLETEAVFDRKTDSFVLNSPKLTSIKFWPGALGRSTNFVLLMAQLYTPDRNSPCGLQMFFVQIRDLDSHEPLPGSYEIHSIAIVFNEIFTDLCFRS